MSALEAWFGANLGPLIDDERPVLASAFLKEVRREHETLAKWALKTAVVVDAKFNSPARIPAEIAAGIEKNIIPREMLVEIGIIHDQGIVVQFEPGRWFVDGNWKQAAGGLAFVLTMQLNHLGIRLACGPGAAPINKITNNRLALRFHPEPQDPEAVDFRFHDYEEFKRSILFDQRTGSGSNA